MSRVLRVRNPLIALSASSAKLPLSSFSQAYSYTRKRIRCDMRMDQPGASSLATFCTTNKDALPTSFDLSNKKCVPCNTKDLRPMIEDAARALIPEDWSLVNEGGVLKLRRSWKVKTFIKGLEFFRIIADLAEAEGHHPDLHLVGWNNVTVEIWTHSVVTNSITWKPYMILADDPRAIQPKLPLLLKDKSIKLKFRRWGRSENLWS